MRNKLACILLSLFIFLSSVQAQHAKFKEVVLKPNSRFYKSFRPTIFYPIIYSENPEVDNQINKQIAEEIFGKDYKPGSLRTRLLEEINDGGLTNLSYEITYNQGSILSLNIFQEGCGAYCSSLYNYFN